MRPRSKRRRNVLVALLLMLVIAILAGLAAARAVLFPRIDSPTHADAIVVVAGANDDRYVYARHLAENGLAGRILVSQPSPGGDSPYATAIDSYCEAGPVIARDGRRIAVECFKPDVGTTEGETTAATRIARERGYDSLLVVTYWEHVSRVRIYFEQCFDG
ncbi:ElyC/SanA/YdcF family protein, partial [Dietzia sp. UCD-THP]|uniref:ElyC/SanA/YdcF family protein n=1 Tax=Dietzia sp. UCD-THP TaxID=1292020 RepID=UPI001EE68358